MFRVHDVLNASSLQLFCKHSKSKCHPYYNGGQHVWLDPCITLMDDKCFEKDAYQSEREAKRWSQREQNWTKVSSLMLHQQLSNQHVAPVLNELRGSTVHIPPSSSAHLCVPLSGSLRAPSPFSRKMNAENPFRTTNQIILYCHFPSPLCRSLSLHPPHSISLSFSSPPPPASASASVTLSLSEQDIWCVMKAGGPQVVVVGGFPITNLQFQELLQLSSPEKKLELCILDIYHSCILSCLTKRILQPQVIFSGAAV